MAPKKKGKGKKGKDEAPPPEPSEFDDMTIDALRQQIAELKPRLDRAQMDRNQVQLDRVWCFPCLLCGGTPPAACVAWLCTTEWSVGCLYRLDERGRCVF